MNVTFLEVDYLFYMLLPSVLLLYLIYTNKSSLQKVFTQETLERLLISKGLKKGARNLLLFVALFCFIIALARPALYEGEIEVRKEYSDLVALIDISTSMNSTDLYPNRAKYAKEKLRQIILALESTRVGIIAFSEAPFLVSPISGDKDSLLFLLENIDTDAISLGGTNISAALENALKLLKNSEEKNIIILSDGGDAEEFTEEQKIIKEHNIHLYTVSCASTNGAPIPKKEGGYIKDSSGNIVITSQNKNFKELALQNGGSHLEVSFEQKDILELTKIIEAKASKNVSEEKKIKEYKELFIYPLALGVLFLFAAFFSLPDKIKLPFLSLLFLAFPQDSSALFFDFLDIGKAKEMYKNGNYAEATNGFLEVNKNKDTPQSHYNLGNAQYKSGEFDKAIESFKNSKSQHKELEQKRLHNLGNSYYQKGDFENAVKAYEESLKNGEDEDTKHNLELAKKQLRQQNQEQQQEQDKQDKKNGGDSQQSEEKGEKKEEEQEGQKGENKSEESKQEAQSEVQESEDTAMRNIEQEKWDRILNEKKRPTMLYKMESISPVEDRDKRW